MALTDRLRDLDQRILPGTREQEEDAETYLRRVAGSRAISPAQLGDVMTALREHFEVFPDAGSDGDGEQKDEASEDSSGEASEGGSDDDSKGEEQDEKDDEDS
ncbi:MAG TPA: hypothetical protein VLR26_13430 [Frankiaceae bacterium]|nr:hypothetical protein [Frankiaceae bacterium]